MNNFEYKFNLFSIFILRFNFKKNSFLNLFSLLLFQTTKKKHLAHKNCFNLVCFLLHFLFFLLFILLLVLVQLFILSVFIMDSVKLKTSREMKFIYWHMHTCTFFLFHCFYCLLPLQQRPIIYILMFKMLIV